MKKTRLTRWRQPKCWPLSSIGGAIGRRVSHLQSFVLGIAGVVSSSWALPIPALLSGAFTLVDAPVFFGSFAARERVQVVHVIANEPVLQDAVAWAFGRCSPGLQSSCRGAEIGCGCCSIEPWAFRSAHLFTNNLADRFERQFGHGCYFRKRKGRKAQAPAFRLDLQKSSYPMAIGT